MVEAAELCTFGLLGSDAGTGFELATFRGLEVSLTVSFAANLFESLGLRTWGLPFFATVDFSLSALIVVIIRALDSVQ
jgi:hypothetical protein